MNSFNPSRYSSETDLNVSDEVVEKGHKNILKVDIDKFEILCKKFRDQKDVKIKNLIGQNKEDFDLVVSYVHLLYGTEYYNTLYDKVKKYFKNVTGKPGTVGGYFSGCMNNKSGNIEFIPFTKEIIKQNCVFEHIYFARPDSCIFGKNVHKTRYRMGEELARENPDIRPDIVVAVPDSGLSAAMGFADESNVPLDRGLIRNHYVGRSFIYPTQEERKNIVRMKLQPVFEVIKGKDIALIDDSMVRGTTAKEIIGLLKQKGVGKIHYFLACPPIKYSCYFGIDTPNRKKLIANNLLPKEIAEYLEIESVNFLSINGLKRVLKGNANDYCYACFAGNYIMEIEND